MITATHVGLVAGALTSLAGVPQVVRVYQTKRVRDLSIWQPLMLSVGITLWLIYGIVIGDTPLIVADLFSLVCSLLLLGMIFLYRKDDNGRANVYYFPRRISVQKEDI